MAKGFAEFKKDVSDNQELYTKYQDILWNYIENRDVDNEGELVVLAAKKLGYEILLADLEKDLAEMQELDLEEMETVSGGAEKTAAKMKRGMTTGVRLCGIAL